MLEGRGGMGGGRTDRTVHVHGDVIRYDLKKVKVLCNMRAACKRPLMEAMREVDKEKEE